MRFFNKGPNIPDLLLDRRDQGRVVFLCGAGVSFNAGMPSFYKLTKYVVDFFDPPEGSVIESEFRPWVEDNESGEDSPKIPLDQIFHQLYQEYGREEVNALVAQRLKDTNLEGVKSQEHSIIARIASDQDGNTQIVTTNFDRLFEQAYEFNDSEIYEPPAFPDIDLGMPLTGITYLHGRLQEPTAMYHPYILSSADFGRAYLSEGWATNFIRSLLKNYTVVLVGYQAEDPPVKYLLQGLNHDGKSDRSNLYAFDEGEIEDIESKWRDRGVTAIACKDYPSLWQSLGAWADRADDPRQWRSSVIDMAMKGPRQLSSHERGQVVHVVRTAPGARLFARTEPIPPPEWLCVFDVNCRVAKASKSYSEDVEIFDPFKEYGLDDDPPKSSNSDRDTSLVHDHILEWRRGDTNPHTSHQLSGRYVAGLESMPPRLSHLSNWIVKNLDSPITVWWAMRQSGLHPNLVNDIRYALRQNTELHSEARRIWNIFLEFQSDNRSFSWDNGWFRVKDRIKKEGWTSSVLRDFEAVTSPILFLERPLGIAASKPPLKGWDETATEELGSWKVKFPDRHGQGLDIPNEILESIFRIAEGHLRRAAELMSDLNTFYFLQVPICYPDREVDGQNRERNFTFKWFLELFAQMVKDFPAITRAYTAIWPTNEKFYFRKLKLFALNQEELFEADEAAESLLSLSQESFWELDVRRELLFLIDDRWEDFSEVNRTALVERLLSGPDRMDHWSEEEYPGNRNEMACRYTRWLQIQNRVFLKDQEIRLKDMISGVPEWSDGFASTIVKKHFGTSGWVSTDETPDQIIDLPVTEVVDRAKAENQREFRTFTDKRPFTGLVKVNPRKALASLSHSARSGEYPPMLWSALISDWPEDTKPRLFSVFLHRLGRLPHEAIRDLSHPIGQWIEKNFILAFKFDKSLSWNTFDHLISGLSSDNGAATESGIGEISVGGEVIKRSRRTVEHAINGPIGKAVEGLIHALNSLKLDKGQKIPEEFKSRLEHLLNVPGEGSDHTIAILTRNISWLYYIDPEWVKDIVMSWFNFDHNFSEPAWNGYLSAAEVLPKEIGIVLKPLLLDLFPRIYEWNWDEDLAVVATQITIELAIFRNNELDGLTNKEARHCLRNMNDINRQEAIFRLGIIAEREENGWSKYVIPFINDVWPRERVFRTTKLVSSWVNLLEKTGEEFPEVLSVVRKYLVPVMGQSNWLFQFTREWEDNKERSLTIQHPETVLELLDSITPNSSEDISYELAQILDFIEETDPSLVNDRRFVRLITLVEQA